MSKKEIIRQEMKNLLDKIGILAEVQIEEQEGTYTVNLIAETDAPLLIGKFGETLGAIQRVMEAVLFNIVNEPVSILVNVNDYRERQKERIEAIAENIAQRVIDEKRHNVVKSFSSFERKLIHEYIGKKYPQLTTHSEGVGPDRSLTIALKEQ